MHNLAIIIEIAYTDYLPPHARHRDALLAGNVQMHGLHAHLCNCNTRSLGIGIGVGVAAARLPACLVDWVTTIQ
ncbi:unnamed protein product [Ceratitis capitata]|uniref:(Mediterranean fruit fly) hypothetical protein n=1 Tax=Ceratitis capitata TaxID=7213 RepID=A0A811TWI1_CERCA|nr:unnamed protein product [Ceratitis capitata]